MTDQIILKSVGSYIETDGMVGPLMANGLPDISEGVRTHINDVSDEWLMGLSTEDKRAVFKVWLDTCPFEYEFSDETEGESKDEPCLWYFFRIR